MLPFTVYSRISTLPARIALYLCQLFWTQNHSSGNCRVNKWFMCPASQNAHCHLNHQIKLTERKPWPIFTAVFFLCWVLEGVCNTPSQEPVKETQSKISITGSAPKHLHSAGPGFCLSAQGLSAHRGDGKWTRLAFPFRPIELTSREMIQWNEVSLWP